MNLDETLDRFLCYRSYHDAISLLVKNAGNFEDYGRMMYAICDFALNGEEPTDETLTDTTKPLWLLIRPSLQISRVKALSGAKGGKASTKGANKQNVSKPQAKEKQTSNESQPIKEIRNKDKEDKDNITLSTDVSSECVKDDVKKSFDIWWDLYDKKIDRLRAFEKWKKLTPEERQKAIDVAPQYSASCEKRFRKSPKTYLCNKSFNDEDIINYGSPVTQQNNSRRGLSNKDLGVLNAQSNLIQVVSNSGRGCSEVQGTLPFGK